MGRRDLMEGTKLLGSSGLPQTAKSTLWLHLLEMYLQEGRGRAWGWAWTSSGELPSLAGILPALALFLSPGNSQDLTPVQVEEQE